MRRSLPLAAALLLAAACAAPAAHAQASSVRRQLDALSRRLNGQGFVQSHLRQSGSLDESDDTEYTLALVAGRTYAVAGVCDNDCSDLDLSVFDRNDSLVDSDDETDDAPVVTIRPTRSGRYRIRVHMHACSVEPCDFGLLVISSRR